MAQRKNDNPAENFFKQGIESISQNVDSLSSFAKDNLDAFMQSANIAAKGAEKITSEAVNASKENIEKTISRDFRFLPPTGRLLLSNGRCDDEETVSWSCETRNDGCMVFLTTIYVHKVCDRNR